MALEVALVASLAMEANPSDSKSARRSSDISPRKSSEDENAD